MVRARLERAAQRHRERTLGARVLRTVVPRTVAFLALAAALLVGNAMAGDPLVSPADSAPSATPAWTAADATAHPGCVPASRWPAGRPANAVVVHSFADGADEQIAFDAAWEANHNDTDADDVWVIGICP